MNNFQNRQLSQVGIFYSILISLCLFCFFSFPKLAYSQDSDPDQIIENLPLLTNDKDRGDAIIDLLKMIAFRKPELAKPYLDSLKQLSLYEQNTVWQAWALNFEGDILLVDRKTDEGEQKIREALSLFESENNHEGIGAAWYNIGKKAWLSSDWVLALKAFSESRKAYKKTGITERIAAAVNGLGIAYYESKLTDKAIETYEEAYQLNEQLDNPRGMASNLVNIGIVYNEAKQYRKSADTYQKALKISQTFPDNGLLVASIHNNLSVNYIKLKEFQKAKRAAQQSYDYHIKTGDKVYAAQALSNIANSNNRLGLVKLASNQYEELFVLMKDYKDFTVLSDATRQAALMHEEAGNHQKANKFFIEHLAYKDSLLSSTVAKEVAALDAKYEAERKAQEIALLNTKNELAQARLSASKKQIIGLGLSLGLFAILSGFLFSAFRKIREQKNVVSKALGDKEVLLKEIHHRVKNNLQVVSSLLSLQSNSLTDQHAKEALQEGRNRVKSMALIHRNLYQDEELTSVEAKEYFIELTKNLFYSYNINPERIKLEQHIQDLRLDVDTLIPLGLIVNELISNALKYAFPDNRNGIITISMHEKNDQLHLQVKDNGVGFKTDFNMTNSKTMGMNLINAFKKKLKADINIKSDNGSVIDLTIGQWKKVG
jgi:two-component sensor histidine kinase